MICRNNSMLFLLLLCVGDVYANNIDINSSHCLEKQSSGPVTYRPIKDDAISIHVFKRLIYLPNRYLIGINKDRVGFASHRSESTPEIKDDEYYGFVEQGTLEEFNERKTGEVISFDTSIKCQDVLIKYGSYLEYKVVLLKDNENYFLVIDTDPKLWELLLSDYLEAGPLSGVNGPTTNGTTNGVRL